MKRTQTFIDPKLKEEMANDKAYKTCMIFGHHGHSCDGDITWEHAMIYAGNKIQEKWAIIAICEKGHAVNKYQDAGTMKKELNQWAALNRATQQELEKYTDPTIAFNKVDYFKQRTYLNKVYGPYTQIIPQYGNSIVSPYPNPLMTNIQIIDRHAVLIHKMDALLSTIAPTLEDTLKIQELLKEIENVEKEILSRMHEPENIKIKSI